MCKRCHHQCTVDHDLFGGTSTKTSRQHQSCHRGQSQQSHRQFQMDCHHVALSIGWDGYKWFANGPFRNVGPQYGWLFYHWMEEQVGANNSLCVWVGTVNNMIRCKTGIRGVQLCWSIVNRTSWIARYRNIGTSNLKHRPSVARNKVYIVCNINIKHEHKWYLFAAVCVPHLLLYLLPSTSTLSFLHSATSVPTLPTHYRYFSAMIDTIKLDHPLNGKQPLPFPFLGL